MQARSLRTAILTAVALGLTGFALALPTSAPSPVYAQAPPGERPGPREPDLWIGVDTAAPSSEPKGAHLERVLPDSPASKAGLDEGTTIVGVGDTAVDSPDAFREALRGGAPGDTVRMDVHDDGDVKELAVELAAPPSRERRLELRVVGTDVEGVSILPAEDADEENPEPQDLSAFGGEPLVVEFWASWCFPCRKVSRRLTRLHHEYSDRLQIVGISPESVSTVQSHREESDVPYLLAADPEGDAHDPFGVSSYPTVFIVDETGTIVEAFTGLPEYDALSKSLDELLDDTDP